MSNNENEPILNKVSKRLLFLSPTVKKCLERESNRGDFYRDTDKYIGKGAFGEVWKVTHKKTNASYVIKVINKRLISTDKLFNQINLEVEIMYTVHHPHLMQLINHYEDEDNCYLIMPFAEKGQLYTLLKKNARFDQRTSSQFISEIISAVKYLHENKIVHRDIKPENILLDENYRVKLSDFGWSNFIKDNEMRKTYCGTPEYLSPEMIKKIPHDFSVDIWSIGVLLFEFLAGYSPFAGENEEELFNNILHLKIKWPNDFPPLAKNLITKILRINPKERLSLDDIINHSWFKHNPPLRPLLVNKFVNERKKLESHLITVKPSNKEVKEKLDLMFPDLKENDEKKIDEGNNNLNENSNKDSEENFSPSESQKSLRTVRKETILRMKNIYDENKNNSINNDGNNIEMKRKISEINEEHENEKEKLNKELENIKNKLKNVENERDLLKEENTKIKQQIFNIENKSNDISYKEEINEREKIELIKEIEDKNNENLELKRKYNEIKLEKERLEKESNEKEIKITELNNSLEIKNQNILDIQKKFLLLENEKNENFNNYQKKLSDIQNNLLSENTTENNYSKAIELLVDNIKEFKEVILNKLNNLHKNFETINNAREEKAKNLENTINEGYNNFKNEINISKNNIKEDLLKIFNEVDSNFNNNKKKEMEQFYKNKIDELTETNKKISDKEKQIEKLLSENRGLKEKSNTVENENKVIKSKEIIKQTEIDSLEEKIDILYAKIEEIIVYVIEKCKEIHNTSELNSFYKNFLKQFNNDNYLGDMDSRKQ